MNSPISPKYSIKKEYLKNYPIKHIKTTNKIQPWYINLFSMCFIIETE